VTCELLFDAPVPNDLQRRGCLLVAETSQGFSIGPQIPGAERRWPGDIIVFPGVTARADGCDLWSGAPRFRLEQTPGATMLALPAWWELPQGSLEPWRVVAVGGCYCVLEAQPTKEGRKL